MGFYKYVLYSKLILFERSNLFYVMLTENSSVGNNCISKSVMPNEVAVMHYSGDVKPGFYELPKNKHRNKLKLLASRKIMSATSITISCFHLCHLACSPRVIALID